MRISCNGCRVLRKGCSENCIIRPCLQWIKSSASQANATLFLAKFYGRAGLVNLIKSGPAHLRPAIFRSLLYEGCGRMVNPIYGSVGLLSSNKWSACQSAVDAVLCGASMDRITLENDAVQPLETCDVRHVGKVVGGKNRTRFRKCNKKMNEPDQVSKRMKSMESGLSADSGETRDVSRVVGSVEPVGEVEVELRLGVEPVTSGSKPVRNDDGMNQNDKCHDGHGLELKFCG